MRRAASPGHAVVVAPPPVQGELALDRIQPVRNDLSDADLEVVPVRAKAAPAPKAVPPRPQGALGEALSYAALPWWRRWRARWLKRV